MELERREFLRILGLASACLPHGCGSPDPSPSAVMTVCGPVDSDDIGVTLTHEHVLVDFIGASRTGYHRWRREDVIPVVLPHLERLKSLGCATLFECTPAYLGRDPRLLHALAEESGMNLVTNTGYYGARDNLFLPEHAFTETADQLAERWVREWEDGIDGTAVRPGFIKTGVDRGALSDTHGKLIRAAGKAHLRTGLPIQSHTGTAPGAFQQLTILQEEGVPLDAFIWVHAQVEEDLSRHVEAAHRGAWVSFDNVNRDRIDAFAAMLLNMKKHGVLSQVLVSHDAGWYSPGEENGGSYRGYEAVFEHLAPALSEKGFTKDETRRLLVDNPARALSISAR
jgi:phosphotriesterase-related protein